MNRDLLCVAEILDKSGHYSLSDKLFKVSQNMPQDLSGTMVMDGSGYLNNPYTPKGVMNIRRQLV